MEETRAASAKMKSLLYEDLHVCLVLSRLGSILVSGTTHIGRGVKNMLQPGIAPGKKKKKLVVLKFLLFNSKISESSHLGETCLHLRKR